MSSKNAIRHGLLSDAPVLPHWETQPEWDAHRNAVHESIEPTGYLETHLAERVALLLWRLRRVARFETEATAQALESVDEEMRSSLEEEAESPAEYEEVAQGLKKLFKGGRKPKEFQGGAAIYWALQYAADLLSDAEIPVHVPGVPEDEDEIDRFEKWTPALLETVAETLANECGTSAEGLVEEAQSFNESRIASCKRKNESRNARRRSLLRDRMIPPGVVERASRYEITAERSLYRALHELQRLQAAREGGNPPLPVAADIDVSLGAPEL